MNSGFLQAILFLLNRPEPIRQSSLLMVLATGMDDSASLLQSLTALATESDGPWSHRVYQLQALLRQGQTLSESLGSTEGLVPESAMLAIRVGEQTGTLKQVLAEEAHRLMDSSSAVNPVRASLPTTVAWLIFIGLTTFVVVGFLMVSIVPKIKWIFDDFGVSLPPPTQSLVALSDWFAEYWFLVTLPLLTLLGLPVWFLIAGQLRFLTTGRMPLLTEFPRYWTPVILRLLSTVVAAGSELTTGLHAILTEMRPGKASRKLSAVRHQFTAGGNCWQSMCKNRFLKQTEVAFLESATRTRHLDWGLIHLARAIERRRNRRIRQLTALVQPIVILFVGAIVGFICIAMFMPLVKMIHDLS